MNAAVDQFCAGYRKIFSLIQKSVPQTPEIQQQFTFLNGALPHLPEDPFLFYGQMRNLLMTAEGGSASDALQIQFDHFLDQTFGKVLRDIRVTGKEKEFTNLFTTTDLLLRTQVDRQMRVFRKSEPLFIQEWKSIYNRKTTRNPATQLRVRVMDESGNSISGATIFLPETTKKAKTGESGEVTIRPLPFGYHKVECLFPDGSRQEKEEVAVMKDRINRVVFRRKASI